MQAYNHADATAFMLRIATRSQRLSQVLLAMWATIDPEQSLLTEAHAQLLAVPQPNEVPLVKYFMGATVFNTQALLPSSPGECCSVLYVIRACWVVAAPHVVRLSEWIDLPLTPTPLQW
jgi:hypothetical protein